MATATLLTGATQGRERDNPLADTDPLLRQHIGGRIDEQAIRDAWDEVLFAPVRPRRSFSIRPGGQPAG